MSQRTSIVLTSILKPVDDTRMFEKFGFSLGQTNKYDVNIIGFAAKNIKKVDNVHFYPLFNFKRTSPRRLLAPWRILSLLLKVKPGVIVFNTPEILYVIMIYKLLSGSKIIYDIQENYFRNIYYNKNYHTLVRFFLAYSIRLKEWSGRWYIDGIILAEYGYKSEMPRSGKRAVVIKNTYRELDADGLNRKDLDTDKLDTKEFVIDELANRGSDTQEFDPKKLDAEELDNQRSDDKNLGYNEFDYKKWDNNGNAKKELVVHSDLISDLEDKRNNQQNTTFLFSGTISDNYGIFTAIDFIDTVHKQNPMSKLLIVGYCANHRVLSKLLTNIKSKTYIKLIGGDQLVPHQDIIKYVREADYGLICYEINPSTENCMPTKIYEYIGNRLPIIIQNYKPWSSFCLHHNAGIEIDYKRFDIEKLMNSLIHRTFYTKGIPEEVFWTNDEKKLLKLVKDIQA